MSAAYRISASGGGTSGTGNRTMTIGALTGDMLIVGVKWSVNSNTSPTCTDNGTGTNTYTRILTALNNASADIMAIFVRDALVAADATLTIAPVVGGGTNTAGQIETVAYTGISKLGSAAVRGSGKQENQTTGVPTPVLPQAALTTNPTLTWAGSTTTAGSVPNGSWQERQDASQATPVTCLEVATRDNGYAGTGSDVPYVSIASSVWSSAILELDGSTAVAKTNTEDFSASFADAISRLVAYARSVAEDFSAAFIDLVDYIWTPGTQELFRTLTEDFSASFADTVARLGAFARSLAEDLSAGFLDAVERARGTIRQLIERL